MIELRNYGGADSDDTGIVHEAQFKKPEGRLKQITTVVIQRNGETEIRKIERKSSKLRELDGGKAYDDSRYELLIPPHRRSRDRNEGELL